MVFLKRTYRYWSVLLLVAGLTLICQSIVNAFPVKVVTPLFEITGSPGAKFHEPTDLVVGKKGMIYIVDGVNDRIQVFDRDGKFLFKFGEYGIKDGQFNKPIGIGIDRQGHIFVADTRNRRIQEFDSEGKFIRKLDLKQRKGEPPVDPTEVFVLSALDEREKLYISDNDNHHILVYDKETFKFEFAFGQQGFEEEGKFRYPHNIAADSKNNIYVVDVLNTRVQSFTKEGKYIRDIGGWGVREGTFFRPKGVAVDANDVVYICDGYMGVVQTFRSDGTYLAVIGSARNKENKYEYPISIYIDNMHRLYVVEELGHKISVFQLP